jgi:hypothetical protein
MGFAPLKLVDVAVGRVFVKLYPRITATMPVYKRAHAFQVRECLTAVCKALSLANAKGKGTDGLVIRS